MDHTEPRTVPAAGGLVRRSSGRSTEVLVVHRPRYDDWTLPKGKLEPAEHPLAAAVREVEEETGVHGVPLLRLPGTRYLTGHPGVEKTVEYWLMRPAAQRRREPDDEVDELAWLPPHEAAARLTYAHDRGVLAALDGLRTVTAVLVAVGSVFPTTSTAAGGDTGMDLLRLFAPTRYASASAAGCAGALDPLREWGIPGGVDRALDSTDPAGLAGAVRALAAPGGSTVVCADPVRLSRAIAALKPGNGTATAAYEAGPTTGWVLSFAGADLLAADRLDATG